MNPILKKFVFPLMAAASLLLVLPAFAQAANLDVQFESTPLFGASNFAPGQSVSKTITVTNNTAATQKIAIEATNQNDGDSLASQFDLLIKQGGAVLYDKTLREFFNAGQIFLTVLEPARQTVYNLTLTFKPEAGNSYQGKNGGFDLLVGFLGQEGGGTPDTPGTPTNTSGGGGGGGGGLPPGLTIFEDQILVRDITQTSAVVSWTTSYNSTSQVVYAADGEPYSFVVNPSLNFGYPHATADNSAMVTVHSVSLTGLLPGVSYHFRVISHASPPTVSFEHQFATLPAGETAGAQTGSLQMPKAEGRINGALSVVAGTGQAPGEVLGETTDALAQVRQIAENGVCQPVLWWPLGYLAYALLLGALVFLNRKYPGKQWFFSAAALLVLAVLWWTMEPCKGRYWYWLALILAAFFAAWFMLYKAKAKPSEPQLPPLA